MVRARASTGTGYCHHKYFTGSFGQARNFYQYAATLIGNDATEDTLAYLRDTRDFKNCLLVEQPNGDWGKTILRQFLFSNYQYLLYEELQNSKDEQLLPLQKKH